MPMLRTLMSLAVTAMLVELAMAANYTVGAPNGGWDTSTNLQTWASSQSFSVGDNLIFVYTPNHDVVEVSKADYDSCQTSSPIQNFVGGNTNIPLASPGKRYFICGTSGHCGQGMKVEIDTLAASASPPASPANPPPTATPSAPPPASPANPPPTATPSAPPPASPATPPVSSPPPETETLAPAHSPKSAPTMSPPSISPGSSPTSSPNVPSTESPANSPLPSVSSPPPPSSASEVNILTGFTAGFGFVTMMVLTL